MSASVIEPGTIAPPAGEFPFVRLPPPDLFRVRAERFAALAPGSPIGDYLRFLAALARAQDAALARLAGVVPPPQEQIELCRVHGLPPLNAQTLARDPRWHEVLRHLLSALRDAEAPAATRAAIAALAAQDGRQWDEQADALLRGAAAADAATPFVGAALQVYWVYLARQLSPADIGRPATGSLCPVCASAPTASVVRIGGAEQGLRYLACSLCASQWHMVRVKCPQCETTKGIAYYGIEGGSAAAKAESCDACGAYLKILYMERDPEVEPVADDVATVALDVLMAERGIGRGATNFFLMGGST